MAESEEVPTPQQVYHAAKKRREGSGKPLLPTREYGSRSEIDTCGFSAKQLIQAAYQDRRSNG